MRSPVAAVLLILAVFFAWYTHDSWLPLLRGTIETAGKHIPESVRPGWVDSTETVYKWKDAQGQSHVSNEPPKGVTNYQTERVKVNKNIVPPPPDKNSNANPGKRARKDYR